MKARLILFILCFTCININYKALAQGAFGHKNTFYFSTLNYFAREKNYSNKMTSIYSDGELKNGPKVVQNYELGFIHHGKSRCNFGISFGYDHHYSHYMTSFFNQTFESPTDAYPKSYIDYTMASMRFNDFSIIPKLHFASKAGMQPFGFSSAIGLELGVLSPSNTYHMRTQISPAKTFTPEEQLTDEYKNSFADYWTEGMSDYANIYFIGMMYQPHFNYAVNTNLSLSLGFKFAYRMAYFGSQSANLNKGPHEDFDREFYNGATEKHKMNLYSFSLGIAYSL